MGANWYVTVRRSVAAVEYLPLAGPFKTYDAAMAAWPWCRERAMTIDPAAGGYWYTVAHITPPDHLRFRGVFTPRGNLFTPWFRGLIP